MTTCRENLNISNLSELSDILRQDLSTFYCCRQEKVTIKALLTAECSGEERLFAVHNLHPTTTIRKEGLKYTTFRNIIGYVTIANSILYEVRPSLCM
jgi:hypothetical protein